MNELTPELSEKTAQLDQPAKNLTKKQIFLLVALCLVLAGGFLFYNLSNMAQRPLLPLPSFSPGPVANASFQLKRFANAEEFQAYVSENSQDMGGFFGVGVMEQTLAAPRAAVTNIAGNMAQDKMESAPSAPDRFSTTNVQVQGIDEPDIVKTNGREIFLSTLQWWYSPLPFLREGAEVSLDGGSGQSSVEMTMPAVAPDMGVSKVAPGFMPPVGQPPTTKVLSAFPPAELAEIAQLDTTGELLLADSTLVVLGQRNGVGVLTGFNVTQPNSPTQNWQVVLKENNQLLTARLHNNKIYLVTQQYLYAGVPCPYIPLAQANGAELRIPCGDIYYPDYPTANIDITYTVMIMDPQTGQVEKTTSIVGSSSSSVLYMSPTAIYLTYNSQADMTELFYQFLAARGADLFPTTVTEKLAKLREYDLSRQAKMVELQSILEAHQRTLSADDRLRVENELRNRMQSFLAERSRDLEDTLIVKFSTDDLSTLATGAVPGQLLSQFSMDEFEGNLRVATTFGQTWTQFGQGESASDVYVLGSNLQQRGVVTDLGKGERIYAVRFLGNKGYVVTFKQIDPFYVLDLRNPDQPEKTGELKIPGYSSYLHPISNDRILGVGMENNQVKLSLFDVSDPRNPTEISKYLLDEYWTEVSSTHHAFLLDQRHNIFFLPGSKGGYVFSYADDQLTLKKAVSQTQAQRALFIDDYLYIVGERQVTVLNESDWQAVKTLDLL